MGISLTGLTPATTYDALIKVGDNGPIDGTLKVLSDGLGTNLPMEASTTGINFTGNLTQSGTALQPVLVSGTNIKTINSTSILGSGNIAVVTSPSGVSGAIQFSNGSAFASDAANFFWDDTNNRLGVGTNTPVYGLDVSQNINGNPFARLQNTNAGGFGMLLYAGDGLSAYSLQWANYLGSGGGRIYPNGVYIGQQSVPTARLQIQGSGSTSATTSLLVQNSAGNPALQVQDNLNTTLFGNLQFGNGNTYINNQSSSIVFAAVNTATADLHMIPGRQMNINNTGSYTAQASALLQVDSTTKGVLFPRMTTILRDAISSPATGLVLYDTTTNKLQCYNGSTWNDLF
jgi:hypothetical protein